MRRSGLLNFYFTLQNVYICITILTIISSKINRHNIQSTHKKNNCNVTFTRWTLATANHSLTKCTSLHDRLPYVALLPPPLPPANWDDIWTGSAFPLPPNKSLLWLLAASFAPNPVRKLQAHYWQLRQEETRRCAECLRANTPGFPSCEFWEAEVGCHRLAQPCC